jgi:hypothetical protein
MIDIKENSQPPVTGFAQAFSLFEKVAGELARRSSGFRSKAVESPHVGVAEAVLNAHPKADYRKLETEAARTIDPRLVPFAQSEWPVDSSDQRLLEAQARPLGSFGNIHPFKSYDVQRAGIRDAMLRVSEIKYNDEAGMDSLNLPDSQLVLVRRVLVSGSQGTQLVDVYSGPSGVAHSSGFALDTGKSEEAALPSLAETMHQLTAEKGVQVLGSADITASVTEHGSLPDYPRPQMPMGGSSRETLEKLAG